MVCKRGGSLGGGIAMPTPRGIPIITLPMLGASVTPLGLREPTRREERGVVTQQVAWDCYIGWSRSHPTPDPQ